MTVVPNIICPVCGCCCDDIEVTVENNEIVKVKNACAMGASKFESYSKHRNTTPMVKKNGRLEKVPLSEAIERSAEILAKSQLPLLYGWSCTSCESIEVGIELAEELGGIIDNTSTICHGPSTIAVQEVGLVGATLGQIRHRADLIIYWGSNPWSAHPRHMERYTALSEGRFQKSVWHKFWRRFNVESIKKKILRISEITRKHQEPAIPFEEQTIEAQKTSNEDRKVVVVDVRKTRSADMADYFVQVAPNKDYEVLQALRALIRDEELDVDEVGGVNVTKLEELSDVLLNCKFGVIFFGLGLTMSEGKHRNVEAAIKLAQDLNRRTKFLIMPMRGHFNVTGADTVFTWQTGYPYAVDFSQGYPRYNPGETSAVDALRREDCDTTLVVAADPVSSFPKESVKNLVSHPLIVVDPCLSPTALMADVIIPSAFVGIEAEGTTYRMDHVPLPLKKIVEPPENCISDEAILRQILDQVRRIRRSKG
ncbi:formylmethanofuran dehydrogenase subunit B [Candidatus Bathyarchaeota archaeon]|nr:formylmethanofuran dehydrogenase subunit B [Candidatus Bathyarchaeota archaeon]